MDQTWTIQNTKSCEAVQKKKNKEKKKANKNKQSTNSQKKKHKTTFQIIWPSFWQGLHQGA